MIKIENLSKQFDGRHVLKDINLKILRGEIHGLIGGSGVGKSTLLNCINRLENFENGEIYIDGMGIKKLSFSQLREIRKNIGVIFQGFSLINRKNVFKNISIPLECWKVDEKKIKKRVEELAEIVGISDKLYSRPEMLSGGQKQRVAIARALTQNPKILLCDECTSALDPINTKSIINLLGKLRNNFGITIVMVSHEISVIEALCDKVSRLEKGKIVETQIINPKLLNKFSDMEIEKIHDEIVIFMSGKLNNKNSFLLYEIGKNISKRFIVLNSNVKNTINGEIFEYTLRIKGEKINNIKIFLDKFDIKYKIFLGEDLNV